VVALLDVGVAHLHAVGDEPADALVHQVLADLLLELAPVALRLEHAGEEVSVEAAVLLQLGHGRDGADDLVLGDADVEPRGLVTEQRVVDQPVERLAAEVDRGGEGGTAHEVLEPALQHGGLLVELAARDALAVDLGDHVDCAHPAEPDGPHPPADEGQRQQGVEHLGGGRGVELSQLREHPARGR
jgi:hypothetical protein